MGIEAIVGISLGIISSIVLVIKFYRENVSAKIKDIDVDVKQNEELLRITGKCDSLKIQFDAKIAVVQTDLNNLKAKVEQTDDKTAKKLEKIQDKIDKILEHLINFAGKTS